MQTSKKIKIIRNNLYFLKCIHKISPLRIPLNIITSLANYSNWVFYTLFFQKYIFDSSSIERSFNDIAEFVIVSLCIFIILDIYNTWFQKRFLPVNNEIIHSELNQLLFKKASNVEVECFESPDFYDKYTKATAEAYSRAISVMETVGELVASCVATVIVGVVLFKLNKWVSCFIVIPIFANFFFGFWVNKLNYKTYEEQIKFKRQKDYIHRVFYLQKFAKEIRLSKIYDVLMKYYKKAFDGTIKTIRKYRMKIFYCTFAKNFLIYVVGFQGMWLLATYLVMVERSINIGSFVVITEAVISVSWMIINFTDSINKFNSNGLFIENLREFLHYTSKIPEDQNGITPSKQNLELQFKNVYFKYDRCEKYILKNITFSVNKGEKIAIVGNNGAGKTTIFKLLMRFYDPIKGEILLNGQNIKRYNLNKYRNMFGTVLQDYQIFSMTIGENVLMRNIKPKDKKSIFDALRYSNLMNKIVTLPHGIGSMVTREFDENGVVLSGGQSQKLTISRAYAKKTPILILDEPSSALDPIAECEVFNKIMSLANNAAITFIISHRLSVASLFDKILLVEDGCIVECGNHNDLMRKKGKYYEMYRRQQQSFFMKGVDKCEST